MLVQRGKKYRCVRRDHHIYDHIVQVLRIVGGKVHVYDYLEGCIHIIELDAFLKVFVHIIGDEFKYYSN